jgi:hypothetical protein
MQKLIGQRVHCQSIRSSNAESNGGQLKANGPHMKSRTIIKMDYIDTCKIGLRI